MIGTTISGGVVHDLPAAVEAMLVAEPAALATWEDITPLARNEWICRVQSVKKPETRRKLEQARSNLGDGKRRPCCWPGRPHREDGAGVGMRRAGPLSPLRPFGRSRPGSSRRIRRAGPSR